MHQEQTPHASNNTDHKSSIQTPGPIDFRLNPTSDLHPLLKQHVAAIATARASTPVPHERPPLQNIPWYPLPGCAWRFYPSPGEDGHALSFRDEWGEDRDVQEGEEHGAEEGGSGGGGTGGGVMRLLAEQQNRGALARQELVSMLPVVALGAVDAEHRVLDLCASPGSKASQLLGLHPYLRGLVVANEFDRRRLGRLHHRLQKECHSTSVDSLSHHCSRATPAPTVQPLTTIANPHTRPLPRLSSPILTADSFRFSAVLSLTESSATSRALVVPPPTRAPTTLNPKP
jgi:hypothetical protein